MKQLAALRKTFVKLTNSATWEDSVAHFPLFACEAELESL